MFDGEVHRKMQLCASEQGGRKTLGHRVNQRRELKKHRHTHTFLLFMLCCVKAKKSHKNLVKFQKYSKIKHQQFVTITFFLSSLSFSS